MLRRKSTSIEHSEGYYRFHRGTTLKAIGDNISKLPHIGISRAEGDGNQ